MCIVKGVIKTIIKFQTIKILIYPLKTVYIFYSRSKF